MNLFQIKRYPHIYSEMKGHPTICPIEELELERQFLTDFGYTKVKSSSQRGYCSTKEYAILNYSGRYGVGYVIVTHNYKSNNLYNIEYWVIK